MPRKNQNFEDQLQDAIEHSMAVMMGKTPKKALIIDGPVRPRKLMTDGLKYLRCLGPIRHFVRNNGTWFEGRANVKDYPIAVKWRRKRRPQGGECFKNAQEFCLANPSARYFEGYYLMSERPFEHAWAVMEDGSVLDFTHEAVIRILKKEKAEVLVRPPLYLGVEVPHRQLAELHALAGPNKPILELYKSSQKRRRK